MDPSFSLEPWWRFGAALLIGALVGLEREYIQQRSGDAEFAGIRTFALLALLGAVAAFFSQRFGIIIFISAYLAIAVLILGSMVGEIYVHRREEGITTEVVGLLMPFLGAMVIYDNAELAAALAVISALVLASKPALHGLASRMSPADLRATLEFALITAVVLPILPNQVYGPYGVLNPYAIWLMVVLVSAIGFFGYVLMKLWGAARGISLTGLLGGLVSSTAVTLSFAGRSVEAPALAPSFALAITLASTVLFPRVLVEVALVHPPLLPTMLIPLGFMLTAGLLGAWWLWRRSVPLGGQGADPVSLKNPLKLTTAITFGLAFGLVLLVVEAANATFGDAGVYAASAITGLVDVDAIALGSANLAADGALAEGVAAAAITLAVLVNTAVKAIVALSIGAPALRRNLGRTFGLMIAAGLIGGALGIVVFR
jgi:uncharacterized membrane protein (DUF4010 family)